MDQKERVRHAIELLGQAIDWGFDAIDASKMGPLGLTKTMLKEMPHEQLLALPGFEGSWLHMLSAEVHGVPVAEQLILSAVLPPAAMLAAQATSDEARSVLAVGATSSIRPPDDDLLVLSPATADAVVYELSGRGLHRIASDVAELVEREVDVALGRRLGANLPSYGFDEENWCVLVAGRRVGAPATQGAVKRLQAWVRAYAEKSGLPLAYVHMGTPIGADADTQTFDGIVGLVLAHASARASAPVERASLPARPEIPQGFFEALASEHGVTLGDTFATYLAPAGWSGASILEDEHAEEPVLMTWAEDTTPGKEVDPSALPPRFWLRAQYA